MTGHSSTNLSDAVPPEDFPVAMLRKRTTFFELVRGSRMWWVTLVCLMIAVFLAWRSIGEAGPEIVIHFPEGHGLRVGDTMRHRGIEVGHVHAVDLNPDLSGVDVSVTLRPGAKTLAREDSRFWIVRPRLSLTEVSGLETAVGAKYIGVSPGEPDSAACYEFVGLAAAPPDELSEGGIEIILRGSKSFGLNPGAPVMWRGVEVGKLLSVDLASDTRYVDVRARIDAAYRRLVRPNSRFWVASGLDIHAGITGVRFHAESLATIARGGVAFITPNEGSRSEPVTTGHLFELHEEQNRDWVESSLTVSLIDFELPPTVTVRASWRQKQLGFTRDRERTVAGLLVSDDRSDDRRTRLIGPSDGLARPDAAINGSWKLEVLSPAGGSSFLAVPSDAEFVATPGGLSSCLLSTDGGLAETVAKRRVRVPIDPEDCCLVRSVAGGDGPSSLIQSISRMQLAQADGVWNVTGLDDHLDDWHGATVVATKDGAAIGMFLVARQGPVIAPFAAEFAE